MRPKALRYNLKLELLQSKPALRKGGARDADVHWTFPQVGRATRPRDAFSKAPCGRARVGLESEAETAQEPGASSEHVTAVLSFLASLVPSMVVMMAVGYLGDGDVKRPRHDLAQFLAQWMVNT